MSLTFDHKAYGYNGLSRSILFSATDGDHDIHFALPRINLEAFVGQEFTSENEMWEVFHANRPHVEASASDYWRTISDQHRREGTATPLGTPLVLPMLKD
ncbi:MAG TPA: hypothetical protein VM659_09845 [Dongiaceae bacterium]|nr:hypothetical protein [Dongiaceae bacterium]